MQNNDFSKIIIMERQDILLPVYHMLQKSQTTSASVPTKKLFHVEKTVGQGQKF